MNISLPDNFPHSADVIADLLKNYKPIAVVGLSSRPTRPSFGEQRRDEAGRPLVVGEHHVVARERFEAGRRQ